MEKLTLPGFWYCDSEPNGKYVASKFNDFVNRFNEKEKNGKQLIWTVLNQDGSLFAGLDANSNITWEWNNGFNSIGIWEGLNAVIYQADNTPRVIRSTVPPTGATGWRYVDDNGNLISSDDTLEPISPVALQYGIKDLWQFTVRDNGNIAIGQGQEGVWAVIDKIHRIRIDSLIEKQPNCRSVRFRKSGNKISICWYFFKSPTDYTSCFLWLTEEELRALIPKTEPIPIPIPKETMRIRAFERPMWHSPYYSFHQRYGDSDRVDYLQYGNAITVLGDEQDEVVRDTELERLSKLKMAMIVDIGNHQPDKIYEDLIIAWLLASNKVNDLVSLTSRALTYYEKPVIAYLDNDSWPVQNPFILITQRIWPSIQAYRFPNESEFLFRNRVTSVIERVAKYNLPMVLTTRFDDFNGSQPIQNILECMSAYEVWLREFNFVAHMPFADRRGNGISKISQMKEHAIAFNYASIRPNRFDYWQPNSSSTLTVLKNKFGQSRANPVIEPYLREDILSKYEDDEEPDPEPPPPEKDLELLLRDRLPLVQQLRRNMFNIPDNTPLNDHRKAMMLTRAVAVYLKDEGWGLVKAKEGSDNDVDGYTSDIIALSDGEHVDVVADGEGNGFAAWQPVRFRNDWEQSWNDAIAARWEEV